MDPIAALVRSVHLLGAITWFGGALAMSLVVLPAVLVPGGEGRRTLAGRVFFGFERIAVPAALATAASGLILGIAYGRITSFAALTTAYGVVWLAAVLVVAGVLVVGARRSSPTARRLFANEKLWIEPHRGGTDASLDDGIRSLRTSLRVELIGLATAFVLMEVLAARL
jgi:uncharacterized membrane protein